MNLIKHIYSFRLYDNFDECSNLGLICITFIYKDQIELSKKPGPIRLSKSVWGMSCGSGQPTKLQNTDIGVEDARQKLMVHGIGRTKRYK